MKKMKKSCLLAAALALAAVLALTGCGQQQNNNSNATQGSSVPANSIPSDAASPSTSTETEPEQTEPSATELAVRFGDAGEAFTLHLYDNSTAAAIARYVGTASWRLPIYHYDDYDNWEVMQYYDIPSHYEIPSNAESVSSEHAGTVYYSEPNRIVLFYQEAEVTGDYTPVGYFDYSEEFLAAVQNNPTVPGWSNKLVLIETAE